MRNRQIGPDASAAILARLVERVTYKDGWTFELVELNRGQGSQGLTLNIAATVPNSFGGGTVGVLHLMPVPPAGYDEETWQRWILEQVLLVERHEALEFFRVDGDQPYFPEHGPGRDPYTVAQIKSRETAHTPAALFYGGAATDDHFQA